MIYYIILLILIFLSFIPKISGKEKGIRLIYIFVVAGLIIFTGLRDDVGFDNESYRQTYRDLILYNDAWNIEPFVQGLIYFSNFIFIGYNGFLFLIALLSITIKSRTYFKYTPYPFLALLLYYSRTFMGGDFGQIRQGLAMAFVFIAFKFIIENNLKKFLIVMFFASITHVSSVIFIPFYFFSKVRIKTKYLLLLLVISIPLSLLNFKEIFSGYLSVLPTFVATKVDIYAQVEASESIGLTFSVFFRLFIILLLISFKKDYFYKNKTTLTLFNIYYFGVIFYLVFNSFPQLGNRGSLYFQQFEILLIPILIYSFKNKIVRMLLFLFLFFYAFWGINSTIDSQPESFIPYKNLLFYDFVR